MAEASRPTEILPRSSRRANSARHTPTYLLVDRPAAIHKDRTAARNRGSIGGNQNHYWASHLRSEFDQQIFCFGLLLFYYLIRPTASAIGTDGVNQHLVPSPFCGRCWT